MPRKKASTKPAPAPMNTPLDRQAEMATSTERFLPANLPEARFRQLLRAAWALGEDATHEDVGLLLDYIQEAINARLDHDRALPVGANLSRMLARRFDKQAWQSALTWTCAALTAEWGHREGFVGPPQFDMRSYDFESQQVWGAPKQPGAMAVAAIPNNHWVAELAKAMDVVFEPDQSWTTCEYCSRNEQFRELSVIAEAIAIADEAIGFSPSGGPPPNWRLSGVVCAVGSSKHYTQGSLEIREHCYHVVHGATNEAQAKCARDQIAKQCGDWCNPLKAVMASVEWSVVFTFELEKRAKALVAAGHLQESDVAFLFAAAAERMIKETKDFESVHIAHSVSHLTMDDHAPRPVRH